ncbi:pantoate--beta-alanine ligase [Silicimonas algicola]|uniref:Pantothenate synthetase n=1 Tax=Silicimonas algicola TaxID=1826607 RepID=A0A316GC20_9RHOB|nr:pantoate--beta-alanine ligase [Silicimonas algicola]AZQ66101.1 pantoate--beta-alanine ligase [Silicimonas algicola]PWK58404.1 pantothenate synthetase [Silicimonas algicola]
MKVCRAIADYRSEIARFRASGETVGLVTTMGALHDGHMALVAAAKAENARVVTTIFVNPTQFGNPADLLKYPRTEEADLAMFEEAGVDAVLLPSVEEIYPEGDETIVETTKLAHVFHGKVRPGHFRGVATVVTKLFNIAQPDAAYFGEKDYQQLAVIRRMVADLHMPLRIVGVPTVRETDGLAMSSRNVRLTPEDRRAAPVLNAALDAARSIAAQGATVEEMADEIRRVIDSEPRATLQGLDIVDAATFEVASGRPTATVGIMISVQFGDVLLIDQREIAP